MGDCRFDRGNSLRHGSGFDGENLEAKIPVGLFVDALKPQCLFQADAPGLRGSDKAEIVHEEDAPLKDRLGSNALQFARKLRRYRMPQIAGQRYRAERRTIMKLQFISVAGRAHLPLLLEIGNGIDKRRMRPGLGDAPRLFESDYIRRSLLNDAQAVVLELADDSGLAAARSSGYDESLHKNVPSLIELSYFASWIVLESARL